MTRFWIDSRFWIKSLSILLASGLALASFEGHSASGYSMKITASKPKGSAADAVAKDKTLPSTSPFTPCTLDAVDALSFKLIYNAGTSLTDATLPSRDVYLFFYNPNALGAAAEVPGVPCLDANGLPVPCDPRVWAVTKTASNFNQIALTPRADVTDIVAATDIYLTDWENLGGTITDTLLRSYVAFDDMHTGLWELVGIVADSATVDFKVPSTWSAWDVETFVIGAPWTGTVTTCTR